MPRFLVAHPHTGADGRRRTPGQVVQIREDEAAVRTRDGFGRVVTAAQAEELQKVAAADAGSMAAVTKQPPPPAPPEPEEQRPPKMSAPKADWVAYLTELGGDPAELDTMTRGQLIARAQSRG